VQRRSSSSGLEEEDPAFDRRNVAGPRCSAVPSRFAIGILQPAYLPWIGYFEQIASVDRFVVLDDVQYTHRDWRNRNRIKGPNGPVWLTVPICRQPLATPINQIRINDEHRWRRRHLMSIRQSYGRCPFFEPFFSQFEEILLEPYSHIVDLDLALMRLMCEYLEITTPIVRSSELNAECDDIRFEDSNTTAANARLIRLCTSLGAGVFYEGARGRDYLDVEAFNAQGVAVVFQDFDHPEYPQRHGGFLAQLSAIDLIMNVGPGSRGLIVPNATVRGATVACGNPGR
jgi:hypothetical protein